MKQLRNGFGTLSLLLTLSCGGTSVGPQDDGASVKDIGDPGLVDPGADKGASPVDVGKDLAAMDPGSDSANDTNSNDASACADPEECFGTPCLENTDCVSGLCVSHLGDLVCSQNCVDTCPPGWTCKLLDRGGRDVSFVCVSQHSHLCLPCTGLEDCSDNASNNACVEYFGVGAFCGSACSGDEGPSCPEGFGCQEVVTVEGGTSGQCVVEGGECSCSETAVALGLVSTCKTTNAFGSCDGSRYCTQAGLTDCDAPTPSQEVCNGKDDDCDSGVDEESELASLCDDGDPCTEDSCDGIAGCSYTPLSDFPCDDGSACTENDLCAVGICSGTVVVCDDGKGCTDDSCDLENGCVFSNNNNPCDDADPCTIGDICVDGSCQTGSGIACDDGNPCTDDSCAQDGGCDFVANTETCDDGNSCTVSDQCADKACLGSEALDCDDSELCTTDSCDPATGCQNLNNAVPCDDGDICTVGDACSEGGCAAGALPLPCKDNNPCTDDSCDPGDGCVFIPNGAVCDDGKVCTTADNCEGVNCVGSEPITCTATDQCHEVGTCDVATGQCSDPAKADGSFCDDGDICSVNDACNAGGCAAGVGTLLCNDNNPCTDDSCDSEDGCVFTPNGAACDDGNACTTVDVCQDVNCVGSGQIICTASDQCHDVGTCDVATGLCSDPAKADGAPCDDGTACIVNEDCTSGLCGGSTALDCDDGDPCTTDSCDPVLGCQFSTPTVACTTTIGLWHMDESDAFTVQLLDSSAQGNNLVRVDGSQAVGGYASQLGFGNAVGNWDFIANIPNGNPYFRNNSIAGGESLSAFTFEFWIRPGNYSSDPNPFGMGSGSSADRWRLPGCCGSIQYHHACVGTVETSGLNIGAWNHVALTWDGSIIRMYLNGAFKSSGDCPDYGALTQLTVGGQNPGNSNLNNALVDEVRLSNIVRYNGESYVVPAGPFCLEGSDCASGVCDNEVCTSP